MYCKSKIGTLLQRYHSGNISLEAYKELKLAISKSSEEEIKIELENLWNEYAVEESMYNEKMESLYGRIHKEINNDKRRRRFFIYFRIAAFLIFFIISASLVRYYVESNINKYLSNQVVVINSGENRGSSVVLPDGTKVRLNVNSSLSYSQDFNQKNRKVLLEGEGFFEVAYNKEKQFIVSTDIMDIKVLGTTFNVYAYRHQDIEEMSLSRGHVEVKLKNSALKVMDVFPNEKVVYDRLTGECELRKASNQLEVAWLSKELVFREEKLRDVFSFLERKFGVNIIVKQSPILDDIYTGVFDDDNVEDILKVLQIHYNFCYEIKDGEIYITPNV